MTQTQIEAQKKILQQQRDLMNDIMDYQIAYGVESVVWNVNIQFPVIRERAP